MGLLGLLSIGIFVLPVAMLATWYLARRRLPGRSMTGLLSGVGLAFLLVAVLAGTDTNAMSPLPWVTAGLLFVLLGVAAYVLSGMRRRSR